MVRTALGALVGCVLLAAGGAHAQGYSVVGPAGSDTATTAGTTTRPSTRGRIDVGGVIAPHQPWEYGGVVPGNGVVPPGLARHRGRRGRNARTVVAWPGFQMTPRGSRIFLAVTAPVQFTAEASRVSGRLVWRVRNAGVPVRNNRRALETEAFDTPVRRAFLRTHGRDAELVVDLRAPAQPAASQQNNAEGLGFVYLDFAPYALPREAPSQPVLQRPVTPMRPAAPVHDDERPPSVVR